MQKVNKKRFNVMLTPRQMQKARLLTDIRKIRSVSELLGRLIDESTVYLDEAIEQRERAQAYDPITSDTELPKEGTND